MKFQPDSEQVPKRGSLLISEPFMDDPYFKRTVVLLCEHNDEGSFGFVLNRYIDVKVHDIVADLPKLENRISVGGPVRNENLFYLHKLGDQLEGSTEVAQGIFMGGHFDVLKDKINNGVVDPADIRFFIGYSGWSENQLAEEIKSRSWLVIPSEGTDLMDTAIDNLWSEVLRDKGDDYSHFANFPKNPSLN
ncbi:MAG: YqgE/AlgH family protein [Flavobacteriales bacterium]|nr:YqgE/AlgH family protein [Flavobacteriales bacterium]